MSVTGIDHQKDLAMSAPTADRPATELDVPITAKAAADATPDDNVVTSRLGLRKFRDELPIPKVITIPAGADEHCAISIRAQVGRHRFHRDLPKTDVWAYEGQIPGPTIEVERDTPAAIDWVNDLFNDDGQPATLPYDVVRVPPTTTGAPPTTTTAMTPGGRAVKLDPAGSAADSFPALAGTDDLTGATVVHLHGALTNGHNDGWSHNVTMTGGRTRVLYPNGQESATLWYHDHAMAVTRFNVYAGLAGFYLLRDTNEASLTLPSGPYELPLMITDRNFETYVPKQPGETSFTGRPLYKQAGVVAVGAEGAPVDTEIPVSGPFNLVNGKVWPTKKVKPRWYRLRILNACSTRTLTLAVHDTTDESAPPNSPANNADASNGFVPVRVTPMTVIGTDGGLLPAPIPVSTLEVGPAERYDVLIDFRSLAGKTLELRNEQNAFINADQGRADATIMQFVVGKTASPTDTHWEPPVELNPDYRRYLHVGTDLQVGSQTIHSHEHFWVALIPPGPGGGGHPELWELRQLDSKEPSPGKDLIKLIDPRDKDLPPAEQTVLRFVPTAKLFDDANSIVFAEGSWAVWNILHLGGPPHPFHIHMTQFQMIERGQWDLAALGDDGWNADNGTTGVLPIPADSAIIPTHQGMKDTYLIKPGEWVKVLGDFTGATGSFMYHCHILDHEDHTMMRPFVVLPREVMAFHKAHGGGHH